MPFLAVNILKSTQNPRNFVSRYAYDINYDMHLRYVGCKFAIFIIVYWDFPIAKSPKEFLQAFAHL